MEDYIKYAEGRVAEHDEKLDKLNIEIEKEHSAQYRTQQRFGKKVNAYIEAHGYTEKSVFEAQPHAGGIERWAIENTISGKATWHIQKYNARRIADFIQNNLKPRIGYVIPEKSPY